MSRDIWVTIACFKKQHVVPIAFHDFFFSTFSLKLNIAKMAFIYVVVVIIVTCLG